MIVRLKKMILKFKKLNQLFLPDGEVEHLPDVGLCEVGHHLLWKDPVGDGGALDDLSLQQFVHKNDHHLKRKKEKVFQMWKCQLKSINWRYILFFFKRK